MHNSTINNRILQSNEISSQNSIYILNILKICLYIQIIRQNTEITMLYYKSLHKKINYSLLIFS